jgi:signal transduction histidine kinase
MSQVTQSVRVRITLAATLVTAVAVALAGWLLVRSVQDSRLGDVRDAAEEQADQIRTMIEDGIDPREAVLRVAPAGPVVVRNEDGETVASNPEVYCPPEAEKCAVRATTFAPAPTEGGANGPTGAAARSIDEGISEPVPPECIVDPTLCLGLAEDSSVAPGPVGGTGGAGGDFVLFATELEAIHRTAETDQGDLIVTVGAPVSEIARSVDAVRTSLWVLFPGLVAIVAFVAWWLAGRALRPVEAIRVEAEAIGGSTIHRRVPEPATGDEIGRLARTMNAMLERLDHSARRQRQFVSDASHELRSPLAAIRTDLEVALREGHEANWSGVATAVLDEELRLETLLADLLVLAADDEGAGAAPLRTKPVDLQELVSEEIDRHEMASAPKADPVVVAGVAGQLQRALGNLVTNAERHARSAVEVAITRVGDRVRVTVDDDGPGIPPGDRERVFERFARLDDGRTRDQGGAGLGLAVVRSIVVRHGGRVWADESPLGGARFTIDLPASAPVAGADAGRPSNG